MKRLLGSVLFFCLSSVLAFSQENEQSSDIRPASFGFSVIINDFYTPRRIRNGSLSSVLRDKQWAKFDETTPGFAVSYAKGLKKYLDYSVSLGVSIGDVFIPDSENAADDILLEADASVLLKLLPENYVFKPFFSAGVGASVFKGYCGAFVPLGIGFRIRLFNDADIQVQSQYRIPATTETSAYHFMHGVGVVARL